MKDVSKNVKSFTRWVFVIGVMTGLFFSGGEGIQLFPFSANFTEVERNADLLQTGKSKSYAFSVYNSNAHSGITKSKNQKNTKYFDCADVAENRWQTIKFNYSPVQQNYHRAAFSTSSDIFISPSDRAPPAV
ncbi:MAG: hypothetical protein LUM44_02120 [Pyrinomonadaceae bacterium]|nr:hypothetical protein [Pyrinomonadaceae bacterium]